MPKVSVIVPVYKVEAYLDRCVQSVLHQSEPDLELILVDDGSPDGCPTLCDGYARKDPRVHVIHQKNGGLSAARNAGMEYMYAHSDSSWLTFLDSDDWIHRDFLKRLLRAVRENQAEIAYCRLKRVERREEDPEPGPLLPAVLSPEQVYTEHYEKCICACAQLISRPLYEQIRFPVGKLNEDAFTTHKVLFGARNAVVLEEPLYYYYFNSESIMRSAWSPRRLDELEGHRVRLQYLREHGYEEAVCRELQITVSTVYEQAEMLAEGKDPRYQSYLKELRKELKASLQEAKGLIPLNLETAWYYLMAWPCLPLWRLGKKAQALWHSRTED